MSEVELTRVEQLNQTHIGRRVRVQTFNGGYVEGTLARVEHTVVRPFGKHVETFVFFEEFCSVSAESNDYVGFRTDGNRLASEVEE